MRSGSVSGGKVSFSSSRGFLLFLEGCYVVLLSSWLFSSPWLLDLGSCYLKIFQCGFKVWRVLNVMQELQFSLLSVVLVGTY